MTGNAVTNRWRFFVVKSITSVEKEVKGRDPKKHSHISDNFGTNDFITFSSYVPNPMNCVTLIPPSNIETMGRLFGYDRIPVVANFLSETKHGKGRSIANFLSETKHGKI